MVALSFVRDAYKRFMEQQKVVEDQDQNVRFRNDANTFVDVERATGVTMEEENEQLSTDQGILKNLKSHLDSAIDSWRTAESDAEGQPWTESPTGSISGRGSQPLGLAADNIENVGPEPDLLRDPAIGNKARWRVQWDAWLAGPTADPEDLLINPTELILTKEALASSKKKADTSQNTPWWMFEDHYALLEAGEQSQLEGTARAAQAVRSRPYGRPGHVAPIDRAYAHDPTPPPDRPFRQQSFEAIGHGAYEHQANEDFEPGFWRRQLESRGDIWAERFTIFQSGGHYRDPGLYPPPIEETLSPRTRPAGWGTALRLNSFSDALRRERKVQAADPIARKPRTRVCY